MEEKKLYDRFIERYKDTCVSTGKHIDFVRHERNMLVMEIVEGSILDSTLLTIDRISKEIFPNYDGYAIYSSMEGKLRIILFIVGDSI